MTNDKIQMIKIFSLVMLGLSLAGCAVSARYTSYTEQRYPAKGKYYFVTIYPASQTPAFSQSYQVIGKVEVSGHASEGVTPDTLAEQAKRICRAKGADAIINAANTASSYNGVDVIPGRCGRRHCRPSEYFPYSDTIFSLRGELIIFMPDDANPTAKP
ncbi:MAG: hypothetical protein HQL23_06060 [Candidatus Omnitrophica bacterium]|nr:hypothetical protein [Candidatus Omnitrophota bacterium]